MSLKMERTESKNNTNSKLAAVQALADKFNDLSKEKTSSRSQNCLIGSIALITFAAVGTYFLYRQSYLPQLSTLAVFGGGVLSGYVLKSITIK